MAKSEGRSIFERAIELEPGTDRLAFVAKACADDPLLESQVLQLLKYHDQAEHFLEASADLPTAPFDGVEQPGTVIGPYKLLQQLGEGGMGVVYMAEQIESIERRVAVKIIKPGMDSRQVIARFEAERQALAMMDHPNIAKVLDVGTTESQRPYFVMELVKGVPITDYCDERRLNPRERLELFLPVCHAVQHAHQKGIIHRDLKPSNILIALYDGDPVAKVIDFGVAKAINQRLTEKTMFTRLGEIVGTLEYMSPEQAQLNQLDIDTRSDIYSLGVLLYELLVGTTPFIRERLHTAAFDEVMRIIREEDPPKPSLRLTTSETLPSIAANRRIEPQKLGNVVRGELDWIAMKCLDKDRARRYPTCSDLAADIQNYLRDDPVTASPPSTAYRIRKFARRHKPLLAWSATVAAILMVASALSIGLMLRANIAREAEAAARADAELDRTRAVDAKQQATDERDRAKTAERRIRRLLYCTHMQAAQRACENSDVTLAVDFLELERPKPGEEDLRGFEWHYYWRLCHLAKQELELEDWPATLATTPDSKSLVFATGTSQEEGELKIIDLATGGITKIIEKSTACFYTVAVSPDGKWIAAVTRSAEGRTYQLILWRIGTSERILVEDFPDIPGLQPPVFSPDSSLLAFGRRVGKTGLRIVLWNLDLRESREMSIAVEAPLMGALVFSPDGSTLVAAGSGLEPTGLYVGDVVTGEHLATLGGHRNEALAFSPDGTLLASGGFDRTIRLWSYPDRKLHATLVGHAARISELAFSPDGKTLASRSTDSTIRLWNVATLQPLQTIREPARTFVFSPSGDTLISVGGKIKHWDLDSLDIVTTLGSHTESVRSVSFDSDGVTVLSAADSGVVKRWNVASGQCSESIQAHYEWLSAIDFFSSGEIVTAGQEGVGGLQVLKIWNVLSGVVKRTYPVTTNGIFDLAYSPDGSTLLSVGGFSEGHLLLWDVESGTLRGSLPSQPGRFCCADYSPDGRTLVSARRTPKGTQLDLWDMTSEQHKTRLELEDQTIAVARFAPHGDKIVYGAWDGTVQFWDLESDLVTDDYKAVMSRSALPRNSYPGSSFYPDTYDLSLVKLIVLDTKTARTIADFNLPTYGVFALSPGGKILASAEFRAEKPGVVLLWDVATGEQLASLLGHAEDVLSLAFSEDGDTLASGSEDRTVILWDASDRTPRHTIRHSSVAIALKFAPDGKTLAGANWDQEIELWDVATGKLQETLRQRKFGYVTEVAVSPDGNTVAINNSDSIGALSLWDLKTGQFTSLRGHASSVGSVSYSPDGALLASSGLDADGKDELILWNAATGEKLLGWKVPRGSVTCIHFSLDGKTLYSGSGDGSVSLWNVETGDLLTSLEGHAGPISSLAFTPDGMTLAVGSSAHEQSGEIKLWDLIAHTERLTLTAHKAPVNSVAFSPDGRTLASADDDGKVLLWRTR